ncbi:hypothetical protein L9F63_006219, partial [Diploptera punctata]
MADTIDKIVLSKENIQPLKRGRLISQLETAIMAQTDTSAQKSLLREKEEFELRLRSYEGDDPLEDWYQYVLWVEQSFPRDAKDGNLMTILQRSIKQFKNHKQYHQDTRYIELWLKYIELSTTPLESFKRCIQFGIGRYSALFYVAWAHELENANDTKRASEVLNEGIKNNAIPREFLEKLSALDLYSKELDFFPYPVFTTVNFIFCRNYYLGSSGILKFMVLVWFFEYMFFPNCYIQRTKLKADETICTMLTIKYQDFSIYSALSMLILTSFYIAHCDRWSIDFAVENERLDEL